MGEDISQKYMARRKFYIPEDEINRDYRDEEIIFMSDNYEVIFEEE